MKRTLLTLAAIAFATAAHADPQLTSWFTTNSGQYARIYATAAAENFCHVTVTRVPTGMRG